MSTRLRRFSPRRPRMRQRRVYPGSTPPFLDAPAPAGAKVLINVTYGSGSETLPTVTVTPHEPLIIEGGCISTSAAANVLTIGSVDPAFDGSIGIGQCYYGTSGGSSGGPVGSGAGGRLTLRVVAAPSLRWVILVYEGGGSTSRWGRLLRGPLNLNGVPRFDGHLG